MCGGGGGRNERGGDIQAGRQIDRQREKRGEGAGRIDMCVCVREREREREID